MSARRFDIVFRGETRDGFAAGQVRDAFAQLFKLPAERVAPLFSGKPCVIKKDLTEADAAKYREVLNRIGADVELRERGSDGTAVSAPAGSDGTTESDSADNEAPVAVAYGWTVAPVGELLRRGERPQVQAVEVPDSQLTLASVFTQIESTSGETPPPPDTSGITVADPGADLGPGQASDEAAATAPATGHISLAPVGPFPPAAKPPPVAVGDLTDLTLAPAGADLLKPDERPPAPAPLDLSIDFELLDEPADDETRH